MKPIERHYQFRERLDLVHQTGRRDPAARPEAGEIVLDAGWKIVCAPAADARIVRAGKDLADYFEVSMNLPLAFERRKAPEARTIRLELDASIGVERAYRFTVDADRVTIAGNDPKGVIAGCIHLEDLLNLREAPFLAQASTVRKPLVPLRMVHSGWGIDCFPSEHLNAIAHAGFTAVVIFVTGIDRTNVGPLDINDVIDRAEQYGLDVILYGYLPGFKHPAEPDAREFFERHYTRLFEYYPKARGVMLVGETAEFPSRDPETTGKSYRESVIDGIPDPKPSPGWWPCTDYPAWLGMVCAAVRQAKPDALVIFNTYNWYYAAPALRKRFLDSLPPGVMVQITFEIGREIVRDGALCQVRDYTISADEPGFYFVSEAEYAHKKGIEILCTANTAGATWDFGVIPYVPVPQQWLRRFASLDHAREAWKVESYYDNHHYGWFPSVVTDLGRMLFWSPRPEGEALLKRLAVRDFGHDAADKVLACWQLWSDAMRDDYVASNEEQYGPLRVGPSYPLIFHPNITRTMGGKEIQFPTSPGAHFGWKIIKTLYQPYESLRQSPGFLRFPAELRALRRLHAAFEKGLSLLDEARRAAPERKREALDSQINLGRFIASSVLTACHVKEWYLLNAKLLAATGADEANALLDRLEALALAEIANAESAIPLVEADSRLGWEPSMEYVTDAWHLDWKIRQVRTMLEGELRPFRELVNLRAEANPGQPS